jgi:Caspase domain
MGPKMTNLGIVIAVSNYAGDATPLPACVRDGEAIAALLRSDARFGEVMLISGDTKSSAVKAKLIDFLNRFKGKEIGHIVFYFSGHGDFAGDDFYYLLSDYEQKRRKQTSLGEL